VSEAIATMEVCDQFQAPAALPPGAEDPQNPLNIRLGGLRAGFDTSRRDELSPCRKWNHDMVVSIVGRAG
jgi:hypothetical protein